MHPWKVSAQFVAFAWYSRHNRRATADDAQRFARANWAAFADQAHRGLGKLLLEMARTRSDGGSADELPIPSLTR